MTGRSGFVRALAYLVLATAAAGCGGAAHPRNLPPHLAPVKPASHPFHFPPAARTSKLRPGQHCVPGRDAFYHRSALKCVNGRLRLLST